MPAKKPTRPAPGTNLTMPRVPESATQRAFDALQVVVRQVQAAAGGAATSVDDVSALVDALTATVAAIPTSGRLLAVQRLTGSGNWVPNARTSMVVMDEIGGGAGGGGAASAGVGAFSAGGGGSSGVRLHIVIGAPGGTLLTGGAFVSGAGGAGGGVGLNGAVGGDSTIVIGGVTFTAKGGGGGAGTGSSVGNQVGFPGEPAGGTTAGGDISWGRGTIGRLVDGAFLWSGDGGSTEIGMGAKGLQAAAGAGSAGSVLGGGGAGGAADNGIGRAGGAGAAGGFIIFEYS